MKSGVDHQPFLINLDNFESQEAINSPYVLTSPRSLKACKKAGVKVGILKRPAILRGEFMLFRFSPEKARKNLKKEL
jgi:hypothetical protein